MTNEELKALSEHYLDEFPIKTDSAEENTRIAKAVIRILRENEAMRVDTIAMRKVINALCGDRKTRIMADRALERYQIEARDKLESK